MNSNFDPKELAKFSPLAVHWWDPAGELKTLHQINPLRVGYIAEKAPLSGKKVVDIGCGGGILSEALAQAGAIVTGVDMNDAVIEVAKLHLLESKLKVEYLHTSAESLAQKRKGQYDVVTCLEMLEHVPDPIAVIKACSELAAPDGHLFFSTLNRNMKSYLFAILGAEYVLRILPKNTHDYAKFIRPSELDRWTRDAGLAPNDMRGISYQPFTQKFSLTDDVSVNYLFYARKKRISHDRDSRNII